MSLPNAQFDVIIAGGGMVGAAMANALAVRPLRIALIEQRPRHTFEKTDPAERAVLITKGSLQFLTGTGLETDTLGTPVIAMQVWDNQGFGHIRLDASEADLDCIGHIVENREVEKLLHRSLDNHPHVQTYYQKTANLLTAQPENDLHTIDLGDRHLLAPLLIVAEGRRSRLRAQLSIAIQQGNYGQDALTATVQVERPHHNVAYQRFLPTGPLAFLPFRSGAKGAHQMSMVWSVTTARARKLATLDDSTFLHELSLAFGPTLGRINGIYHRASYPLTSLHAHPYAKERAVVIGDSAHGIHPLAGLGVNLGFSDARTMRDLIFQALDNHQDIGSPNVLSHYRRRRMPETLATLKTMDLFHHLFANDVGILRTLRDFGMLAVHLTPALKSQIVRRAAGAP